MTTNRVKKDLVFNDLRPEFMDGMAYCSCYISTTDKKCGECPQFIPNGFPNNGHACQLGCGTQGGQICTPYYREVTELKRRLKLLQIPMDLSIEQEKAIKTHLEFS
jgi:hypothetical protein